VLKEQARAVAVVVFLFDILMVAGAFTLAHWVHADYLPRYTSLPAASYPPGVFLALVSLVTIIWAVLLLKFRQYHSHRTVSLRQEAFDLLRICVGGGVLLALVVMLLRPDRFVAGSERVSQLWIAWLVLFSFVLLLVEKLALRLTARFVRARGRNYRTVLIVGTSETARAIAGTIERNLFWGFKIIGFLTEEPSNQAETLHGYPVMGSLADLGEIVEQEPIDEVIFTVTPDQLGNFNEQVFSLQELGVSVRFALQPHPAAAGEIELSDLAGVPLITYASVPATALGLAVKRLLDIVGAAVLLVLLSPLLLILMLAVKISSVGPALFRHTRVGLHGREFALLKFRTMIEGAEELQSAVAHLNEMSGPVFKISSDPRVTRLGGFLRKHSLDELPQLLNVLRGDMSLVGPRPPTPAEVAEYERWQRRRLSMRPGLTCLWQVSGRNRIDFDEWMELDLRYIDSWSPWLDLKILLKTIPAVLSGSGAS
jgi:exopolysaccharide biosynthesis polyprenyl glycosylphosphotransferase